MACLSIAGVCDALGNIGHAIRQVGGGAASEVDRARRSAEARVGRLSVEGRYHRLPRRLEHDYSLGARTQLGTGYSGAVILAKSLRTGKAYAVKSFSLVGIDPSDKDMFASEVGIYLSLDHPHVARLMAVYESETEISMVMECCEGGELHARVHAKRVYTEEEAARATWQMLLAINYLHNEGVVHRDLKLENFLYDEKGSDVLKLIDFGFSNFFRESTAMRESCGTLHYIAPEVLSQSYFGGSCDMWSLGVIVYILLAGHVPFDGACSARIIRAISAGAFTMRTQHWSNVSLEAQDFVKKLLVVKPADRMTAQQAMRHPWLAGRRGRGLEKPSHCIRTRPKALARSDVAGAFLSFASATRFQQAMRQPWLAGRRGRGLEKPSDCIRTRPKALARSDVAGAFLSFASATRFQQACMQMMALTLPSEERRLLGDAFLDMDTSDVGVLRLPELDQLLKYEYSMSSLDRESVRKAMEVLDLDKDGEVHYSDFLAVMMAPRLKQRDWDAVEEAFRRFDAEGVGYLTVEGLWRTVGKEVSGSEFHGTFRVLDVDSDGRIYLDDFAAYLHEALDASSARLKQA